MTTHATREAAIAAAGRVLARAQDALLSRSVEESARAAYYPGGPSTEELEARIRARLGLAAAAA